MITCIIIDDEPLALDILEKYISQIPTLKLMGKFTLATEAIEVINSNKIDVLFLDIHMPNITGLQFAQSLIKSPMIVFTTAYSNYAMDSYELNAVDYLLKPISFERFLKTINKITDLMHLHKRAEETQYIEEKTDFIFIKSEYQVLKINYKDILYVEGLKDYVKIIMKDKTVLSLQNLKTIEAKLPAHLFIRIHKSYIISLSKIDSFQKGRVQIGEKEISIGEIYKEPFMKRIGHYE